jgi:hypothetical protein
MPDQAGHDVNADVFYSYIVLMQVLINTFTRPSHESGNLLLQ